MQEKVNQATRALELIEQASAVLNRMTGEPDAMEVFASECVRDYLSRMLELKRQFLDANCGMTLDTSSKTEWVRRASTIVSSKFDDNICAHPAFVMGMQSTNGSLIRHWDVTDLLTAMSLFSKDNLEEILCLIGSTRKHG